MGFKYTYKTIYFLYTTSILNTQLYLTSSNVKNEHCMYNMIFLCTMTKIYRFITNLKSIFHFHQHLSSQENIYIAVYILYNQ